MIPSFLHRRTRVRPSTQLGWIMMASLLVLFGTAADRLIVNGYAAPFLPADWHASPQPEALAGRWLTALFVWLMHLIPGTGREVLALTGILFAAALLGFAARTLLLRGWEPWQTATAVMLTGLHPALLYPAITGEADLPRIFLVGLLMLSVDRVEALGDAQSLMGVGLAIAFLLITSPNGPYSIMLVLTLLPIALRDIQSVSAAVALFLLATIPGLVLAGGILIAASALGVPASDVLSIWVEPLHGAPPEALRTPWLVARGGHFGSALAHMAALCAVCTPQLALIVWRILSHGQERNRPVTALLALVLPSVAGATATFFWQAASPWRAVALSSATCLVWVMATTLRHRERLVWLALMLLGDILAWGTPLLWDDPDRQAWLKALL